MRTAGSSEIQQPTPQIRMRRHTRLPGSATPHISPLPLCANVKGILSCVHCTLCDFSLYLYLFQDAFVITPVLLSQHPVIRSTAAWEPLIIETGLVSPLFDLSILAAVSWLGSLSCCQTVCHVCSMSRNQCCTRIKNNIKVYVTIRSLLNTQLLRSYRKQAHAHFENVPAFHSCHCK